MIFILWLVLQLVIVLVIAVLFNYWKAYLFDDEFASIIGIKTGFLEYLLFVLIAISVVVLIRVVGIILVLALFTAPTAIAGLMPKSLKVRMAIIYNHRRFVLLHGIMAILYVKCGIGGSYCHTFFRRLFTGLFCLLYKIWKKNKRVIKIFFWAVI